MKTKLSKKIHNLVLNDEDFLYQINPYNNKKITLQKKLDTIACFIARKNRTNKIPIKISSDIEITSPLTPKNENKKKGVIFPRINNLLPSLSTMNINIPKLKVKNKEMLNLFPLSLKKNNSNYKINFFNDFEKSFYFDSEYFNLKYDASEIFKNKIEYDRLVMNKVNFLKKGIYDNELTKFEKTFYYGVEKKEINLTLNSLTISLEDMALPPEKQNKNLKLTLPIALLPLFYYKGIDTFQKLLAAIVRVEYNFEKISFDENAIKVALNNISDFKNIYSIDNPFDSNKKSKKYECLRSPALKRNLNFLNFNYFIFFWVTNTRAFSAKVTLPCIKLDIIENQISMKLFIDYELLFFLYKKKFNNWEFYVIKYLSTYSQYRTIFEQLGSNKAIFNKTYFLKQPRTKINNFSTESLYNIYTDPCYNNQIINFNSFYINVSLIDKPHSLEHNYKIIFSFFQYLKLYEIAKYSNKISFLSKFFEIDSEKHTLNFKFKDYDEFDVNLWMENMKKFSGSSLKNNTNINEELSSEFEMSNKKVKIEYKKPLWSIIKMENNKEVVKSWEIGNEMEAYLIESIINPNSWNKFLNLCLEKVSQPIRKPYKAPTNIQKKKFLRFSFH